MTPEKVILSITIDTECDHSPSWARSNPLTFHSITQGIGSYLQPVFNQASAIPTYLLTVEVMENPACVATLQAIDGIHELGTHLHAAFIQPEKKYADYAGVECSEFQCFYPPDIERQKLQRLTQLFVEQFGYQPRSFRAGRFGAGNNTFRSLEALGYTVDCSVTPHLLWKEPRGQVDYRHALEQPYYPHDQNFLTQGEKRPLLEVPVSMKKRYMRGPQWFRPWFSSVSQMQKVVNYHLKHYAHQPLIVLNMMFHSMEVIPQASPYPQNQKEVHQFLDDLSDILHGCRQQGIEFCKACDIPRLYQKYNG
jgi:hypothetical protein